MKNDPFLRPEAFDLERWRDDLRYRRYITVYATLQAVQLGFRFIESCVVWLKDCAGYADLPAHEQNLIQQYGSYIRKIARNWDRLDDETQLAFAQGEIPPSTLSSRIAKEFGSARR